MEQNARSLKAMKMGEKQYYTLVLIKKLFKHLLLSMTIGILYDIACQLDHQWPCQLVYHPHKCEGFRLSDGEGCKRLWSALKLLIPPLHVSGYHQCLFILNVQVWHLNKKNLNTFGKWLSHRWTCCQTKKSDAGRCTTTTICG
ncbi:uncharacterized protein BJ212DRAFT_1446950 [Suillus subaureus]|uniref:Uncharacterized protein n=1 Tax=Suillus subaureus TaxID=48587 RepID=A0A9P7EBN5_9AGAM|nr:uncharacterized protein BJ212DRAFT_1446950 [Suillus subaureus]KAG1816424.1 hypothetical protein BJ212DRAFT_1446950 [Suillus subaureus]